MKRMLLTGSAVLVAVNAFAALPTVRDAYTGTGDTSRIGSLRHYLRLVVCRAEYDAWVQATPAPLPALSLYLDGRLMKGIVAPPPAMVVASPDDADATAAKDECTRQLKAAADADEKDAADKGAAAKAATEAAAAEKDAAKKAPLEKDAKDKAEAEKAAAAKAAASKRLVAESDPRYMFAFYLDSRYLANSDTKEPWLRLLERPWDQKDRPVSVSVGPDTGPSWPSRRTIEFERINLRGFLGWAALFVAAIVLFVRYARSSDIIRDDGVLTALPSAVDGVLLQKSYSLARTQMALWTFLVAGALAFIFLVTWNENTITAGVLTLLGVSFGTTLIAGTATGAAAPPRQTRGFVKDLLDDGSGVRFDRYQMVLFTIILSVIFIVKTATALTMPEFDNTLLGLMGISSGTYLGFKFQKQ